MMSRLTEPWYRIREIRISEYIACLKPIYMVLEKSHVSSGSDDKFMKTILASYSNMTPEQWEAAESNRRHEKALSMKMGDFHEELIGKLPGYTTLPLGHPSGVDVKGKDRDMIEVKNRDNTLNSDSAKSVIAKLEKLMDNGYRAILVYINSDKKRLPRFKAPERITIVNGRQIYAYASGRETFYDDLMKTMEYTFRHYSTYAELSTLLT